MRQTETIISTYSADVFGVCSALFELGGMSVIHDPSGCNSTYTTHDEPRWYDHDSMVFLSGLTEMEAILGDDEKLIGDMVEAAQQLNPRFIALAGTPIPMMTGCDLHSIAMEAENRTGIPSFAIDTNGMQSYVWGAGEALTAYAMRMVEKNIPKIPHSLNILGCTPMDFSTNGQVEAMKAGLTGWQVLGTWAMGSTPEDLAKAGAASVNRIFGTPYVVGTPYHMGHVLELLEKTERDGEVRMLGCQAPEDCRNFIIGEAVTSRSLAFEIHEKYGKDFRVICPVDTQCLGDNDLVLRDEEDIGRILAGAQEVIADPLYRPIVPCVLHELPHEAFSGRLFRKRIPNLVNYF